MSPLFRCAVFARRLRLAPASQNENGRAPKRRSLTSLAICTRKRLGCALSRFATRHGRAAHVPAHCSTLVPLRRSGRTSGHGHRDLTHGGLLKLHGAFLATAQRPLQDDPCPDQSAS